MRHRKEILDDTFCDIEHCQQHHNNAILETLLDIRDLLKAVEGKKEV